VRVAVFGAAGIVGAAVVQALRFDPDKRVDAVIAFSRTEPASRPPHVEWRVLDVGREDVAHHLVGVDALVNLAWERPGRHGHGLSHDADGNVAVARRVLEAAAEAGVHHVVQGSSFAVYSPVASEHAPVDESWPTGGTALVPLARQAVEIERFLDGFAAEHQVVRLVRIRAGVALGPGAWAQLHRWLGPLAERAPTRLPVLVGVRGARLPVVHHDDLAAAYRAAVTGSGSGPYNVALDPPLDLACAASALDARPLALPAGLVARGLARGERIPGVRAAAEWLALVTGAAPLDSSRARLELGWDPVHPLDESLRSTVSGRRSPP
jgi:UDP-glucose 4-epimerase